MSEKKVLIIDDEPDFLKMMTVRLEANNYKVTAVSDGRKALKVLKIEKPDVVLLDLLMPGFSGIKILKKIRNSDKNLPVFIVTAFPNDKRLQEARDLGASGLIAKGKDLDKEIANITVALRLADKYNP